MIFNALICFKISFNSVRLIATETTPEIGDNLTAFLKQKNTFENSESLQHQKNDFRRQFNHLDKGLKELVFTPFFYLKHPLKTYAKILLMKPKKKSQKMQVYEL